MGVDVQHGVHTTISVKQGVRSGTDDKGLKISCPSLLWTGSFKILAVGASAKAPDGKPLADKLLYLDLPSDMPTRIPKIVFPWSGTNPAQRKPPSSQSSEQEHG